MKRFCLVLVGLFFLVLVGCGGMTAAQWQELNRLSSGLAEVGQDFNKQAGQMVRDSPSYQTPTVTPLTLNSSSAPKSQPTSSVLIGYTSPSGTSYQYDLTDPTDRHNYRYDYDAQRRDQMSTDPDKAWDEMNSQNGGGIYND